MAWRRTRTGDLVCCGIILVLVAAIVAFWVPQVPRPTASAEVTSEWEGVADYHALVSYKARPGQSNRATFTRLQVQNGDGYLIDDSVVIHAKQGCSHPDLTDLTKVLCVPDQVRSAAAIKVLYVTAVFGLIWVTVTTVPPVSGP
jgi:hypothetical protein